MGTVVRILATMPPADNKQQNDNAADGQDKELVWFFDQQTERLYQLTSQGWKFYWKANIPASRNSLTKFHITGDTRIQLYEPVLKNSVYIFA